MEYILEIREYRRVIRDAHAFIVGDHRLFAYYKISHSPSAAKALELNLEGEKYGSQSSTFPQWDAGALHQRDVRLG